MYTLQYVFYRKMLSFVKNIIVSLNAHIVHVLFVVQSLRIVNIPCIVRINSSRVKIISNIICSYIGYGIRWLQRAYITPQGTNIYSLLVVLST